MRVSGPCSESLAHRLFPHLSAEWESHRLRQSTLYDPVTHMPVDAAMGVLMCGPHSYTGEDVFEIHCHGSPLVLERVVAICLAAGCRAARPGEFTLRAFLNGRLDLTQAEAVLDIVQARSNAGLEVAIRQLSGWLSERVEPVRHDLMGTLAHMEAMVDFVEDDIPPHLDEATRRQLTIASGAVEALLEGTERGIILREGATLAIVGSPNVGKSSIMNALLGSNRSIVTPIAGTTRDTVEETLEIRGVPFRTVDTAGITATDNPVEEIGVERSKQALEGADVVLLVVDGSRLLSEADDLTLAVLQERNQSEDVASTQRLVVTVNKCDLPRKLDSDTAWAGLHPRGVVESSTVLAGGMDELRSALADAVLGSSRHEFVAGNVRHGDALRRAKSALDAAFTGLRDGTPLDLVSFDVREAAAALGEITGVGVDDELLDRIFRDFCIGK